MKKYSAPPPSHQPALFNVEWLLMKRDSRCVWIFFLFLETCQVIYCGTLLFCIVLCCLFSDLKVYGLIYIYIYIYTGWFKKMDERACTSCRRYGLNSKRHLNTRQTVGCGIPSFLLALRVWLTLATLKNLLNSSHILLWYTWSAGAFAFTRTAYLLKLVIPTTNALPRWRMNVETKTKRTLHGSRQLSFNELKKAKNLVLYSSHFALNWRCCHGCALDESSSGDIWKLMTSSFKCYVDHSHTMYSSGNIEVRNWVHLCESRCICIYINTHINFQLSLHYLVALGLSSVYCKYQLIFYSHFYENYIFLLVAFLK